MANTLTSNGLITDTLPETIANLETGFKNIYGEDLNVESNSPTGQVINIVAQAKNDILLALKDAINSFDPDVALGRMLDQRCAINGVFRIGASFTDVYVDITTDRQVTLQGLDNNINSADATGYAVQDSLGNQYYLANTTTLNTGTTSCLFRAKLSGFVNPSPNSITNLVTIVLGVLSVNNPSNANTLGQTEEPDNLLRLRRQYLVAKSGVGYIDNMIANLLATTGVTNALVWDNDQNTTDIVNNIAPKTMWCIVEGGADNDIATVIYSQGKFGQDTKGNVLVLKTTEAGQVFQIRFDRPVLVDLYIKFDIKRTKTGTVFNQTAIKNYIANNLDYAMNVDAETSSITAICIDAISTTSGGGVPLNVQISLDNITYTDFIDCASLQNKFNINVNKIFITELP
jgi:uncharacterized phage protein gp47/JayE